MFNVLLGITSSIQPPVGAGFDPAHLPLTSIAYRTYCLDPGGREVRRVSPFHFENLADTSKAVTSLRVFGESVPSRFEPPHPS